MPAHDPKSVEARRSSRLSPKGSTHLEAFKDPAGLGPDIAVRVMDISATGARLLLAERLPHGHRIGVALYGPGPLPIVGVAKVVWTGDAGDGNYFTGVEFERPTGADNLASVAKK